MSKFTIYLGNKNYSPWSLRGWLMVRAAGIDFDEVVIPLREPGTRDEIRRYSPSGFVPVLHHGERKVWDTLAIGEYLAELFPDRQLWPAAPEARALARSVSAEMHASFAALRQGMPMNIRGSAPGKGMSAEVQQDINRVAAIWRDCRTRFGAEAADDAGFLFGAFTNADAMYAPVVSRLVTYAVDVDDDARAYIDAVWSSEAMKDWRKDAGDEPQIIEEWEL